MNRAEFNRSTILQRLQAVVAENLGINPDQIDTTHVPYTLIEIAAYLKKVSLYDEERLPYGGEVPRIQLVQFASEDERGYGCNWCGG
jgi:hypothetical protein